MPADDPIVELRRLHHQLGNLAHAIAQTHDDMARLLQAAERTLREAQELVTRTWA